MLALWVVCLRQNGKLRLITQLRRLKYCINRAPKFLNENIDTTLETYVWPMIWRVAFIIPVCKSRTQTTLGFLWNSVYYKWHVLPFALNASPYCAKILRPAIQC